MSDHDDFADGGDGTVADWVADEVDAAWDDGSDGDDAIWVPDDQPEPEPETGFELDGDLDATADLDLDDDPSTSDDSDAPTIDLPLDDDAGPDPVIVAGGPDVSSGFFDVDSITELASGLAPDLDVGALRDALVGMSGDDPGVDARSTVQLLDGAGVDAVVSHGTLDDLADALDAGGRVVIAGEDGARYDVVSVDFRADVLVVEGEAGPRSIPLEAFEDAWAEGAFEMVVASGDDTGGLMLLPMSLD